tara:strand:- start:165 stop:683 length:519 start_codon:yes stop_codon:yes gene_type:complete
VSGSLLKNKIMIKFDPGLIIWTTIIFTMLLLVLKKFAWKPILKSVEERSKSIQDALEAADKAKEEMATLTADNERIIAEAKVERDNLLKEAREIKEKIINEAKESANIEAEKIIVAAKEQINNDKMQAITELKNNVAKISIEMTEKILKKELINKESHKDFISTSLKQSDLN